jgi:hypothetical protein
MLLNFWLVFAHIQKFETIDTCHPPNTAIAALPDLG